MQSLGVSDHNLESSPDQMCFTSSLTIHIGVSWGKSPTLIPVGVLLDVSRSGVPVPLPPQPAALLAVRSPKDTEQAFTLGPGLASRLQRVPLQGPLDTKNPDPWLSQSHHQGLSKCQALSKCRGHWSFSMAAPCLLPTPLAPQRDKALKIRQHWPRSHKTPHPDQLCTGGYVALDKSLSLSWATNFPWECELGQWGNLGWASEGIWMGQCFSNNYCLQLRARWQGWRQKAKCESPAPSAVGWFLFHQNHWTVDSLAKSSWTPPPTPSPVHCPQRPFQVVIQWMGFTHRAQKI